MRYSILMVILAVLGLFLCGPVAQADIPPGTEEVIGEIGIPYFYPI